MTEITILQDRKLLALAVGERGLLGLVWLNKHLGQCEATLARYLCDGARGVASASSRIRSLNGCGGYTASNSRVSCRK